MSKLNAILEFLSENMTQATLHAELDPALERTFIIYGSSRLGVSPTVVNIWLTNYKYSIGIKQQFIHFQRDYLLNNIITTDSSIDFLTSRLVSNWLGKTTKTQWIVKLRDDYYWSADLSSPVSHRYHVHIWRRSTSNRNANTTNQLHIIHNRSLEQFACLKILARLRIWIWSKICSKKMRKILNIPELRCVLLILQTWNSGF